MATKTKAKPKNKGVQRTYDARPDTIDFRDRMYEPTLVEVPSERSLEEYRKAQVPILDQGQEGACTGYGLATMVHYLLRTRRVVPDVDVISPRMLYVMARRYDEWPGEKYSGSSARGAMKGWHKHGVCTEDEWPSAPPGKNDVLTNDRASDAVKRPLGSYFRVNHRDLVAMHSAIAETGILFATANVHSGWDAPKEVIKYPGAYSGGHAFAIVGYDTRGFWIQNSWGVDWGKGGFALLTYDDWLANGTDVWVARLGVPVTLTSASAIATSRSAASGGREGYSQVELRPHIISLGNDGQLRPSGTFGTDEAAVKEIFANDFPRITDGWKKKRLLLYAHGGLVSETSAVQHVADYCPALLASEVYPISFIWKSDFWTTLTNMLSDVISKRRPEGFLDAAKNILFDRIDDGIEVLARHTLGKAEWDEMKENALAATVFSKGGARIAAQYIAELVAKDPSVEIHFVGHSAGSIFHAPLIQLLASEGPITGGPMTGKSGLGLPVKTCTLWAPACTMSLFRETYLPLIRSAKCPRFSLFTLTDRIEQDDNCAGVYHKSLLYLVSNAFENTPNGVPILGMQRYINEDSQIRALFKTGSRVEWVLAPNDEADAGPYHSTAHHHGDFDDDAPTVTATLCRILGVKSISGLGSGAAATKKPDRMEFHHSSSWLKDVRKRY